MTPRLVVSGAGIAGLSSALELARGGAEVTVLERRVALAEFGAGIQLSPNATRHLRSWGLLERLTEIATRPEAIRIRRGVDGVELVRLPLQSWADRGSPFLLLHRADMQDTLAQAVAAEASIDLRFGTEVLSVNESASSLAVELKTQDGVARIDADGLIQAGGVHSARRSASGAERVKYSGRVAWRALVPADLVDKQHLRPETNLWLGPQAHLVHYPLRSSTVISVVVILEEPEWLPPHEADNWSADGQRDALLNRFDRWHAVPKALLAAAPSWQGWPLFDVQGFLASERGRETCVGDAAHPMLPFLAQGASQSIEDAAALAQALVDEYADLPRAFRAYEGRRCARAERIQRASRDQGRIYHLRGPAALARDTVMRALGPRGMFSRMAWLYES